MGKGKVNIVEKWSEDLGADSTQNYVQYLRERGDLLSIGEVDVDVPEVIKRRFMCDSHRCIHWAKSRPLLDRSCCQRYGVPVTERDRKVVLEKLPEVRKNLPANHRLQDKKESPFKIQEDYSAELVHDGPLGSCQFTIYQDNMRLCALHMTALQKSEDPREWKPVACSLWPIAITNYTDVDGNDRLLLTIYSEKTKELFEGTDDDPFACIVDDHTDYPRLFESERGTLEFAFGEKWWQDLSAAAKKILDRAEA